MPTKAEGQRRHPRLASDPGIELVEDYSGPYNTGFNWDHLAWVYLNE